MEYRTFAKTGQEISLLGMGTMRLPLAPDGRTDEAASIDLIRRAIDGGVNYVDTAYMYHDGLSEVITGKALGDGYREKVLLADKMPIWLAKDPEDMARIFDEQFARLATGVIDMYLVHNVTEAVWRRCQKFGLMDFLSARRDEGRIRHIGFSFHDELPVFLEVLDAFPWDFCQIQFNYMDLDYQAGEKGLRAAGERGIPVIIMEPLKGGKLTDRIPPAIQEIWDAAPAERSAADWAFRFVAEYPEVLTILSGMGSAAQLDENLDIFSRFSYPLLTADERARVLQVAEAYRRTVPYGCTGCKYCLPCPQKIDIPSFIDLYNEWHIYDHNPKVMVNFGWWFPKYKPSTCTACKACEDHCPQGLPISDIMREGARIFEGE